MPTNASRPKSEKPFGKAFRLRTRAQLHHVREEGVRRAGRYCVAAVAAPPDGQRKLAIITSRRYNRKAVVRNRARRLLREAYRLLLPEMRPVWLVLIPRYAMQGAGAMEVLEELRRLLTALHVLEPPPPPSGNEE